MNEEIKNQEQPVKKNFWKELISYAITATIIVVPIRMFIAQPFIVNGPSMNTTFANGEYLIIDEISYRFNEPERGEVIIFRYPLEPKKYFIKRIIGLPLDTVVLRNNQVTVTNKEYPGGLTLEEPYIKGNTLGALEITLKKGEYFVLGDNRQVSSDSRSWGVLPRKNIIGRPLFRLFPIQRIDYKPGVQESVEQENK